jgi:hypothetical protein
MLALNLNDFILFLLKNNQVSGTLVITFHEAGRFSKKPLYLSPYKGVCLYVEAKEALQLPVGNIEEIITSQMWIPRF